MSANSRSTKIWRHLARNLCICKNVISDRVWILSENHPKAFQMFPTSITACKNRAYFLPGIKQFDWSISDQLQYSLKIYQFGCIALFYVFRSWTAQIKALNPLLVYFSFWHLENNKINERIWTKATVGISQEIWCSIRETGRFDEKLGDSQENWALAGMIHMTKH